MDEKINVCITQHMQAWREGMLSEGTRLTLRTPKRLAVPWLLWLRRMGVRELLLICILQQKREGMNMRASVKTFITFTLCLIGR